MQAPREKTLRKMKIIRGQVEGIIRMMEEDRYCIDISTQLLAVIAALKSVNRDVLTAHLENCVKNSMDSKDEEDLNIKIQEIIQIMQKLSD